MLNRKEYPSDFDSYGKFITREALMDSSARRIKNNCLSNCSCNSNPSDNSSNNGSNCPADDANRHFSSLYLKYNNLRIKYVGFIYECINYIVDLDNRKVMFKPLKETKYQQLQCRVNVTSDNLTKSYKLGFHLYKSNYIANVEIYPNDIENCNVILTDRTTHNTEMLDKDYVAFEFFDAKNMLDEHGNIITFVNYQDIFKLDEQDLMTLFTYTESITFMKSILNSIMNSKDLTEVVKKLLIDIRAKYMDYMNNDCPCTPPSDLPDDSFIPSDDGCDCCNPVKPPHHPDNCRPPKPPIDDNHCHHHRPHKPGLKPVNEKELLGTYYNKKDNETISLNSDKTASLSFIKNEDSYVEWSVYYVGDINCDIVEDIILELNDVTTDETYKFFYNPKSRILTNASDSTLVFERDIKEIPSLDFSFIGNDYTTPSLIFRDGVINDNNGSIEVVEDYDNFKSVKVELSKKYVSDKGVFKFIFQENNTMMVDNNIYLTTDIDFNDENPEYKHWFKKPFAGSRPVSDCDCGCHGHKEVYIIKLKDEVIKSIEDDVITDAYVVLKCKYKEDLTSEEYFDRTYQVDIKLV